MLSLFGFFEAEKSVAIVANFSEVLRFGVPKKWEVDADSFFLHVPEDVKGVLDEFGV